MTKMITQKKPMNIIMNIRRGKGVHKEKATKMIKNTREGGEGGGMCAQDNVINMIINIKKDDNHDHEHKKKATVAIRMEKVKTTIRSMKRQQSQLRHKNH
jgi:hypothetical protein